MSQKSAEETTTTTTNDMSSNKHESIHRRMVSLPSLDAFLAKSKQLLSSSLPEISPIPESSIEDSDHVTLISSSTLPVDAQRSNSFSSDSVETPDSQTQTTIEFIDSSRPTTFVVTSPSFNSDLSSEQNDSIEQLNPTSLTFLHTKQRRIHHRRNKSEPVKSASTEELSSSTPILDSPIDEIRKKSSVKINSNHASPLSNVKQSTQDKVSSSTTTSRKKKAWYNPFQTTYRQRYEEFRKLFKDLPDNERLIVDYSCAWQKDILVQGRMYLSQNYLCFYANILNWKTSLCLKFQDIDAITREKTAKVISNAIEMKTNKAEKYFFASFVTRDKTHAILCRLWQAARNNQTIATQQLWTMIHECYGDDLDMTTDEEDTYHRSSLNSPSDKISSKSPIQSNDKYDLSNIVLRIAPKSFQPEDDRSSVSSRGEQQSDDEGIIPIGEEAHTNTLMRRPPSNFIDEDTPRTAEICYLTQCPCSSHLATQLINRTYSMSVERLFDYIFGDNDFIAAYRASRRIKDYHGDEWKMNDETGKRERLLTYKVSVSGVFGSTTICSNERQVIVYELSKSHYIIDTEVRNEGIKYADTFYVASRYCLVQTGLHKSHLKVTCEVRYVKSLMAIIKTFIEKNAMAALQDSFTDLMKRIDQESSTRPRTLSVSHNHEIEPIIQSPPISIRRLSRQQVHELISSVDSQEEESSSIQDQTNSDVIVSDSLISSSRNTFFMPFCLLIMLLLLLVNMFLYMKLNQIDQMTDRLLQNYPSWLNKYSYQQEDNQWSSLLKQQEDYYQTQLNSLHSILMTTHNALRNVTDALNQLSKLSSGSS